MIMDGFLEDLPTENAKSWSIVRVSRSTVVALTGCWMIMTVCVCWGSGIDRYVAKMNVLGGRTIADKKYMVVVFLFQLMYRLALPQIEHMILSVHTGLDI